jgi:hypothetical protein
VSLKVTIADVVVAARPLLTHLNLIGGGGGGKRERRPAEDELVAIVDWLKRHRGQLFADIVEFAKPQWADIDEKKRLIVVRDRKDPRKKIGNDQWVLLLGRAWDVVCAQPKADGDSRIFPICTFMTCGTRARAACSKMDSRSSKSLWSLGTRTGGICAAAARSWR